MIISYEKRAKWSNFAPRLYWRVSSMTERTCLAWTRSGRRQWPTPRISEKKSRISSTYPSLMIVVPKSLSCQTEPERLVVVAWPVTVTLRRESSVTSPPPSRTAVALHVNALAAFVAKRQVIGHRSFLKTTVSDSDSPSRDQKAFFTFATLPATAVTKSIAWVRWVSENAFLEPRFQRLPRGPEPIYVTSKHISFSSLRSSMKRALPPA